MAGEYQLTGELRQQDLDLLSACGLTVQVLVDCSHNQYVKTVRSDRPGQSIITKPIELDAMLSPPADPAPVYAAMQRTLTTQPSMSVSFQVYKLYQRLMGQPTGGADLRLRGIKVEIPRFDRSILNLAAPQIGTEIAKAIRACTAKTVAEFNALPIDVRRSMGMYRREGPNRFVLSGPQEPGPRTAVP